MKIINVHYALQICDLKFHQFDQRICGNDRTLLSKKSILAFLKAVKYCSDSSPSQHHIAIIYDQCTDELLRYTKEIIKDFACNKIKIDLISLSPKTGIVDSIRECYKWLSKNGKDIVYQVQDDYIFFESAIFEAIDVLFQIKTETGHDPVINPHNDAWFWGVLYRNQSTPRAVICGKKRYWIQYYDSSCTFLTTHDQFEKHWDLYDTFFSLIPTCKKDGILENRSLNYMFTRKGVLGLCPVNNLAFHLQTPAEEDPYVDWRPLWDSLDVEKYN